jgi:hypothetical protein
MQALGRFVLVVACVTLPVAVAQSAAVASATMSTMSIGRTPHGSTAAMDLKRDMRKLWIDHVVLTHEYIIAAVGDQPGASAAAARLMQNQEDIGHALGKVYGAATGERLATLLKEHVSIAVDLIDAAKSGDNTAQERADIQWQQNAIAIADFLSNANPNWPMGTLEDLMKAHLSTTTYEIVARLDHDRDGDVRAFDAVYDHILLLSDALSDGIIKQFPGRFGATSAVAASLGR